MSLDRRQALIAGLAAASVPSLSRAQADPIATTTFGQVRGVRTDNVLVFKGIRYGADTATTRFAAPRPPTPWKDIAPALAYGAAAPQGRGEGATSEDCLFLNVWTSALRGTKRPVLFYIHGGAYSTGSGSSPLYDGTRLVHRGDVVVVTVNHRLNLFGYLYLARDDARFPDSGNAGQLDLILALQWVRDNIAAFGGDPGNVTCFGQSGGGAKIATLMATPAANGLFHKAVTMSGQQVTASGPLNAQRRAKAFLETLKMTPAQAAEAPVDKLLAGMSARDPILLFGGVYFGPVLDERSLTRHPFFPDAPAQSASLPMVLGNTRDETRAFLGGDPKNFALTWEELPAKLPSEYRSDIAPETVIAEYRRLYPSYSPSDVFFAATTAGRSWRGQVEELEARARQNGPTWSYQVNFKSPRDGGKFGAQHTIDIPLIFDNTAVPGTITGDGPDARKAAEAMSGMLLTLAKTGAVGWPHYDLAKRATMIFDTQSRVENDPRGAERRLFAKVPFVQAGT